MFAWQAHHERLETALALDVRGFQQVLHQLEHGDYMALFRFGELGHEQNSGGEQALGRVVKKAILPVARGGVAVAEHNGFIDTRIRRDFIPVE